jgi:segregation and condensation protein A
MQDYTVLLENFEGPLDLLLQLVEREKLDIRDVAVSQVTQSYIVHIRSIELEPDEVNHFLAVATQLLLTKSRRVLPKAQIAEDDVSEEDLADRLERYQYYRGLATALAERTRTPFLLRPPKRVKLRAGSKQGFDISKGLLETAWEQVSERKTQKSSARHTVRTKPLSLDAVLRQIVGQLQEAKQLSLDKLIAVSKNQHEAVLSFLAILELAKVNRARIEYSSDKVLMIYPGVSA